MAETVTPELTDGEMAVLSAIIHHIRKEGIAPTRKEIMAAIHDRSESGLHMHLTSLWDKKYLTWRPQSGRSIRVFRDVNGTPFKA